MEMMQQVDLVSAELDYQMTDFTAAIVSSIQSFAETLNVESEITSDKKAYTEVPMQFDDSNMSKRYEVFMGALRIFMQQSKSTKLHVS